jgi:hypothetical protein
MYMGLGPETKLYNEWKVLFVSAGSQWCVYQIRASKAPQGYTTGNY